MTNLMPVYCLYRSRAARQNNPPAAPRGAKLIQFGAVRGGFKTLRYSTLWSNFRKSSFQPLRRLVTTPARDTVTLHRVFQTRLHVCSRLIRLVHATPTPTASSPAEAPPPSAPSTQRNVDLSVCVHHHCRRVQTAPAAAPATTAAATLLQARHICALGNHLNFAGV